MPVYEVLVLFSCCDDLITDLFRVYRHSTSGRYPKRLESIGGLDEFSLATYFPLWSSVLKKTFSYRIQPMHMSPSVSLLRSQLVQPVAVSLHHSPVG
jgi:hypothetical protein